MGIFNGRKVDLGNYVKVKDELCIGKVTSISNSMMFHVKIKAAVAVEEIDKVRLLSIKDLDKINKRQRKDIIKEIVDARKTKFNYADGSPIYIGDYIEYSVSGMAGSVVRLAQIIDVVGGDIAPLKVKVDNVKCYITYLSTLSIKSKVSKNDFEKRTNTTSRTPTYNNAGRSSGNGVYGGGRCGFGYGGYGVYTRGYSTSSSSLKTHKTATFFEDQLNDPTKEFLAELTTEPKQVIEELPVTEVVTKASKIKKVKPKPAAIIPVNQVPVGFRGPK